ncbi:hypothetical protein [Pseudomonas sp.]|uniref:hypothetical protein n=1 Tax=Pseudomonas sp. TaxID=306 RepID=UPI0039821CA4
MTTRLNDKDKSLAALTREALADVDADLLVDHQLVEAWAKSLSTASPSALPTPAVPA